MQKRVQYGSHQARQDALLCSCWCDLYFELGTRKTEHSNPLEVFQMPMPRRLLQAQQRWRLTQLASTSLCLCGLLRHRGERLCGPWLLPEILKKQTKIRLLSRKHPSWPRNPPISPLFCSEKVQIPYFVEVVTQRSTRSGEQLLTAERADRGPTSIIVTWPKAPLTTMTGP